MLDARDTEAQILIVDDQEANVRVLEGLLEHLGYTNLHSTTDPRQVLPLFQSLQPDLLLLDLLMPHLDGFAVLAQVRAVLAPGDYLPILVLTADITPEARHRALAEGATDFLTKPFDASEVLLRIHNLLQTRWLHRQLQQQNAVLEEKVRERTRDLQAAQRLAHLGSWECDLAGGDTGWSAELYRILGLRPQEVRPGYRAYLRRVHPADRPAITRAAKRLTREHQPFALDQRIVRPDGTIRIVHAQGKLVHDVSADVTHMIGTLHDVTDRKRTELLLEAERRRAAYDLHDGLAQMVAGIHQRLQTLAASYRPRSPHARQELAKTVALAQEAVREARRLIAGLRPTALDDFGLATALHLQVQALRGEGWQVGYEEALGAARLSAPVEAALFWVAQEALTNVRKHAGTRHVRLALYYNGPGIRFEIQDDGCGFHPTALPGRAPAGERVGLAGMRERIALLEGSLAITSWPGAGTLLVADIPLPLAPAGALRDTD